MNKQSFNRNWTVTHGLSTIMENALGLSGKKERVDLPHDVLISRPRFASCVTGPGMAFFEGENVEYNKRFFVSASEKNQVHYLSFDGVYMNATVFVNNRFVTKQAYGYTPFTIRLDEYLNYDRENTIRVVIRGSAQPNARWYPGLGIYRDVSYMTANLLHIVNDGLKVTTLDCDNALAMLEIRADLFNADHTAHRADAYYEVKDADGRIAATGRSRIYVSANDKAVLRIRVGIDGPRLWDAENPNLYTCELRLEEDGNSIDNAEAVFGIRKICVDSRHGLRINGKSVKLRGGCIHHDNGMLGAVSVLDAELRKISLMKSGGYNAIRTAHNPPSAALLEACDRVGMYVMNEFTDVWTQSKAIYDYGEHFSQAWEQDIEAFVNRDYNHPSVIMWSIGNEIPETGDPVSCKWGRKLVEKIKSLDSSRPVTNGINIFVAAMGNLKELLSELTGKDLSGGINDIMFGGDEEKGSGTHSIMSSISSYPKAIALTEEAADMLDIVGYNYMPDLYEKQHELHPDRVFFGSEAHAPHLDHIWEIVMRNPYVIGDFCWTGWDYLGEVGGGRLVLKSEHDGKFMGDYPYICAYQSDFNLIGDRRPMSFWRDTIWTGRNHQPYISVHNPARYGQDFHKSPATWTDSIPTWSWTGQEGRLTAVEIYSDAEEVELLVNGVSLGRKAVGDTFHKFYTKYETQYRPGKLEARSYIAGELVGSAELKTVGNAVLNVKADKTTLRAGSNDLCYLMVELRDENGTLDMLADKKVTAAVSGAVLAGMGSADPMTEESYRENMHRFFEGKVLAIVKAGEETGNARVIFSCEGCEDIAVELSIV